MTLAVRAVFWVLAYLGAVLAPLVFAVIGASQPNHRVLDRLLGRARIRRAGDDGAGVRSKALHAPLLVWFGMAALVALVVLIASPVWRRRLRLSYEAWHVLHTGLALVLVIGALLHVFFVDEYVSSLWKQILWGLMSGAFVGLLAWVRLVKPRRALALPWRLARVVAERGDTTTLVLESAERQEVELAVKALGDFTSRVGELEPGTTVYVDGPHGVFSIDQDEGPGFGLIAGGVGIAGLISMLRTMADRQDVRPAVLVYANREWDGVAFREELEQLKSRLALTVVHVLERPPDGWTGETGHVTAEVLSRHLPAGYRRFQFFICGPDPMMDAAEAALIGLGVPPERVHTERFDMV